MNFHQRNKRNQGNRSKKIFIIFILFVGVLFLVNYSTGGSIGRLARAPLSGVYDANTFLGSAITGVEDVLTQKETLREENIRLKERVQELELYALNNIVLSSENLELRRLLGNETQSLNSGILANILANAGTFPYGTLVISQDIPGSYSIGSMVFGPQNVLLGSVTEVGDTNAVVRLTSAPGETTHVLIGAGERMNEVTIKGIGNGNMIAEIARDADVKIGDPAVLFDAETVLVGYVGDIEMKSTNAFQRLYIRVPINSNTLRFVRVR